MHPLWAGLLFCSGSKNKIIPMQMCYLTRSIRPLWRKRSGFEERQFPLLEHLLPWSCLAFLHPPASPSCGSPLKGGDRPRERDPSISGDWAAAPPPALHCFYPISQPCCHGTEDGTSTLVLNDLLDDSLLVRHLCPVLLKRAGAPGWGALFEHFILSLTGSEHGVMGYLPNELS